ncbi:MAG: rhodanese-like domain-containing protein [Burkholderiales bacterium]
MATSTPRFSAVNEFDPVPNHDAIKHFEDKLRLEVDPADVHFDMDKGLRNFVVIDTRSSLDFEREHIPGAINLPHRQMNAETTKDLPRDQIIVTYCWGAACNGSTKGALNLAKLGFKVKEMIGGIEGWKGDGFATTAS